MKPIVYFIEVETTNLVADDKVVLVNIKSKYGGNLPNCPFDVGTILTIARVFRSQPSGRYARVSVIEDPKTENFGLPPMRFRKIQTSRIEQKEKIKELI